MRMVIMATTLILLACSAMADEDGCLEDWMDVSCPIVINFAGGYALSGAESPVVFDIMGTGEPLLIGWTAAHSDEAFLCLDRDENGMIDSGAELFGNAVVLADGRRARNGFVALSTLDENHDLIIDADDPVWSRLQLWRDSNHDGISQPSELSAIDASDVSAVDLDYQRSGRRDVSGNTFRYQSEVWLRQRNGPPTPHPVYDIFFVAVR